jgi:hypothetical protein
VNTPTFREAVRVVHVPINIREVKNPRHVGREQAGVYYAWEKVRETRQGRERAEQSPWRRPGGARRGRRQRGESEPPSVGARSCFRPAVR